MDEKLMELLMDYYLRSELEFIDLEETKEGARFYDDIITPVWDYDMEAGRELENKYIRVLCAVEQQSFKNGFLACKHFLLQSGIFS